MKARDRAELPESRSRILPLLTLSMFLSAALLFAMQPMFGKMILPVFGGAPAVWITSVVFFQLMLLAGYLYVHATTSWLGPKKQAALHAVLLLTPLIILPIRVLSGWGLTSPLRPISSVFLVLLASVGLPFFVVSATAPLLQRWFGSTTHTQARDPFFLYAASNLGSIGALLAYPVIVEPRLRLDTQTRVWSIGYMLLVLLLLACALAVRKSLPTAETTDSNDDAPPIPWTTRLRWIALAAVPSSLMLSVTTHITTDIAPIPLLWVIPLTIYLVTFVLAFSRRTEFLRRYASKTLPFVVFIPLAMISSEMSESPSWLLFHLVAFFLAAMACHGELAASRPGVNRLTEFYVWLAIGGAIGGLFNVVVAPIVFPTLLEYPIGLILACLLRPTPEKSMEHLRPRGSDIAIALGLGVLVLAAELIVEMLKVPRSSVAFAVYVFAVPAAIALVFYRRPVRFALAVAMILLAAALYPNSRQTVIATQRSFYGVYQIVNRDSYRALRHGSTNHGVQLLRPQRRCIPSSYYYPTGPLGELFATFTGTHVKSNIGIIGLGTGSTGGYAQTGQTWTFYEIDPKVESIARNPEYFTFLRDCVPQARVVLGDARISLANQPNGVHDLIVVDAFTSDAIPVHLLTREALALYLSKLARGGVLAFHISNRYADLRPVLSRLARDGNLVAYLAEYRPVTQLEAFEGKRPSAWVMMARSNADIEALTTIQISRPCVFSLASGATVYTCATRAAASNPTWLPSSADVTGLAWTDNYSNVLETLMLR